MTERQRGCCTACDGKGRQWYPATHTGYPCEDCYATGHSHPLLCGIPDLTDDERDKLAYHAYSLASRTRLPQSAVIGMDDDGNLIRRPEAELKAEFERWRTIGDAITATGFNKPGDWT
jgi:hypothetical protein